MERSAYMVRGTGIKTKFDFVQEKFGEAAVARYRGRLIESIRWPILVGGWYTFDHYVESLTVIAEMFYGGSMASLREVGSFSAEKLLTSTYQAFRSAEDLDRLVERLPSLYGRFYNCGAMYIDYQPSRAFSGFRFAGAPVYVLPDMEVAVGFTKRCFAFMGAEAAISDLVIRENSASFQLRWVAQSQSSGRPATGAVR